MKVGKSRGRPGISELTGSLLMIALTLIAGAAVFGWVDSQAATSEGALGARAAAQADYFKESFVVVGVQFYYNNSGSVEKCSVSGSHTYCNEFAVDVYNNGEVPLTIESVVFYNSTDYAQGGPVPLLYLNYNLTEEIQASTNVQARSEYTTGGSQSAAYYICGSVTSEPSSSYKSVTTFNEPASTAGSFVSQPVKENTAPPAVYTFTLPSNCALSSSIVDGASYTLEVVGYYGNAISTEVTANG